VTGPIEGTQSVLDFWLDEIGPAGWWVRSDETDAAITARFRGLWDEWRTRPAGSFLGSADEALAGVILFDQFPRNMFRKQAQAFATDPLALAIAEGALDAGLDRAMDQGRLSFLYMPLMHSEDLARQERSVELFDRLGLVEPAKFARLHRDLIARYGRFPARNEALGRENRPGEDAGIAESRDW